MLTENSFIETYLKPLCPSEGSLSLGDDAAILKPSKDHDLIISKDMAIAGHHFFETDDPSDIAYKALAVNLSDIAAKGARPQAFMLGLAFPAAPEAKWAEKFTNGLKETMKQFEIELLGGDTTGTKGPFVISITIFGQIEKGRMVKRSGAQIGDQIYVSGTLGDAALGFKYRANEEKTKSWSIKEKDKEGLLQKYLRPTPQTSLSTLIKDHATSAMDLSDGLIADLEKLCTASNCGALVNYDQIPLSKPAETLFLADPSLKSQCLCWGDDYEILFTIPQSNKAAFSKDLSKIQCPITNIGTVESSENGIVYRNAQGEEMQLKGQNFRHF